MGASYESRVPQKSRIMDAGVSPQLPLAAPAAFFRRLGHCSARQQNRPQGRAPRLGRRPAFTKPASSLLYSAVGLAAKDAELVRRWLSKRQCTREWGDGRGYGTRRFPFALGRSHNNRGRLRYGLRLLSCEIPLALHAARCVTTRSGHGFSNGRGGRYMASLRKSVSDRRRVPGDVLSNLRPCHIGIFPKTPATARKHAYRSTRE